MKIGIPKERRPDERRVAASPDTAKRLAAMGHEILVEKGAGAGAAFTDEAYAGAGASVVDGATALAAEIVLKVQAPLPDEIGKMKKGAVLIGLLQPLQNKDQVEAYAKAGLTSFAMEL
ncbi:MAG TPA: NAD(P)(+) transhydrogenase (Re/Si-specific) subunit alpha, partial [Stellaceae bacterium]|nr:NAD(P)(+) transhydrogenase (Re/Si-specific) subunit alpha [Stellaceae bacterium]